MKELVCLSMFVILAGVFAIAMVVAGFIFQYKQDNPTKNSSYECGIKPSGDAKIQFDIKYFNYAIMFLIFDIETIFLYPFAVSVNELGKFAIIEAFAFVGLLLFGLIFAIKRNMLRWI